MSEYIMGLGISVKICKLYEELVYLSFKNKDMSEEYLEKVRLLNGLIEDENIAYDRLDFEDIENYFDKISKEDTSEFDSIKKRYYLKLKERKDLSDSPIISPYEFTLDTTIIGKILLDSLVKLERQFSNIKNSSNKNSTLYDLYCFHKTYKYNLISSNEFLERLAVDSNFDLCSIKDISFDMIKEDFRCNDNFYKYLDSVLYLTAKDIISFLFTNRIKLDINDLYSDLFSVSQLEVIVNYISKDSLLLLVNYCKSFEGVKTSNSKYVNSILKRKLSK